MFLRLQDKIIFNTIINNGIQEEKVIKYLLNILKCED